MLRPRGAHRDPECQPGGLGPPASARSAMNSIVPGSWPASPRHSIGSVPDTRDSRRWSWPRPVRVSRAAQQEADRRAGEQLAALLNERDRAEVDDLLARGKSIYAVRRVRELTGLRLIDARRLVNSLQR